MRRSALTQHWMHLQTLAEEDVRFGLFRFSLSLSFFAFSSCRFCFTFGFCGWLILSWSCLIAAFLILFLFTFCCLGLFFLDFLFGLFLTWVEIEVFLLLVGPPLLVADGPSNLQVKRRV